MILRNQYLWDNKLWQGRVLLWLTFLRHGLQCTHWVAKFLRHKEVSDWSKKLGNSSTVSCLFFNELSIFSSIRHNFLMGQTGLRHLEYVFVLCFLLVDWVTPKSVHSSCAFLWQTVSILVITNFPFAVWSSLFLSKQEVGKLVEVTRIPPHMTLLKVWFFVTDGSISHMLTQAGVSDFPSTRFSGLRLVPWFPFGLCHFTPRSRSPHPFYVNCVCIMEQNGFHGADQI